MNGSSRLSRLAHHDWLRDLGVVAVVRVGLGDRLDDRLALRRDVVELDRLARSSSPSTVKSSVSVEVDALLAVGDLGLLDLAVREQLHARGRVDPLTCGAGRLDAPIHRMDHGEDDPQHGAAGEALDVHGRRGRAPVPSSSRGRFPRKLHVRPAAIRFRCSPRAAPTGAHRGRRGRSVRCRRAGRACRRTAGCGTARRSRGRSRRRTRWGCRSRRSGRRRRPSRPRACAASWRSRRSPGRG